MHLGTVLFYIITTKRAKKATKDSEKIAKLDELQCNLYAESLKKSVKLKV